MTRFLDRLNRAIIAAVLALVFLVGAVTAVAPAAVASFLRDWSAALDVATFSGGHLAVAAVAIPLALVSFGLLVLELRVRRPGAVALAGDSAARLSTETVVDRLRRDVEGVPDVIKVRPTVTPRRRSVDIDLAVDTSPEVDVPAKAAEIQQVARQTTERLGLKLGNLSVRLSHTGRGSPPK